MGIAEGPDKGPADRPVMTKDARKSAPDTDGSPAPATLTPAAQRALAEAEARRKAAEARRREQTKEVGGRDGPEPTRYGDWEKDGLAKDF